MKKKYKKYTDPEVLYYTDINNEQYGHFIFILPNKQKDCEGYKINGGKTGVWKYWHNTGEKQIISTKKNEILEHGIEIWFKYI